MKHQLLYKDLAKYYDLIYEWKDYKKEVEKIEGIIKKTKKSRGKDLLEMACGTAHHMEYFKKHFNCVGADLNRGILEIAKKKIKGVEFKQADMVKFNFKKEFDVILCLFSSIGYVKTYKNLKKTLENFARHLKPGGVLIIEPWYTPSTFKLGWPHVTTYDSKEIKISRLTVSKQKGSVSIMDMNYLIAEKNKEVLHFIDRHELGLFEIKETLKIMRDAGFSSEFKKDGLMKDRGLYICKKPL